MIHTIQGDIRIEELEIVVKVVLLLIEGGDEGVHGEEGRGEAVLAVGLLVTTEAEAGLLSSGVQVSLVMRI